MGPSNQNMWKSIGVFSRRNEIQNYIPHPCNATERLYFMADTPHLLKNIRNCLLTQSIVLPEFAVQSANLSSRYVSIEHVRQLVSIQDTMELKLVPSLKKAHVFPGQYQKMKVNMAATVISHTTASALRFCQSTNLLPSDVLATAWFLDLLNKWFESMNARFIKASLFRTSSQKLDNLNQTLRVIQGINFTGQYTEYMYKYTGTS